MPAGLEKITEVERMVSVEGPQAADLYLKSAIEGVVIKWAYLVNDVVTHESSAAFENGQNPTPNFELEYWSTRLANLRYKIYYKQCFLFLFEDYCVALYIVTYPLQIHLRSTARGSGEKDGDNTREDRQRVLSLFSYIVRKRSLFTGRSEGNIVIFIAFSEGF